MKVDRRMKDDARFATSFHHLVFKRFAVPSIQTLGVRDVCSNNLAGTQNNPGRQIEPTARKRRLNLFATQWWPK
jgi:hypothetical protein